MEHWMGTTMMTLKRGANYRTNKFRADRNPGNGENETGIYERMWSDEHVEWWSTLVLVSVNELEGVDCRHNE